MNKELQISTNEKIKNAADLIDQAIPLLCQASSGLILDRQFSYGIALANRAQETQAMRASVLVHVIEQKDSK